MPASPLTRAYGRGCSRTLFVVPVGAVFGVILVSFALFVAHRAQPGQELAAQAVVGCFTTLMIGAMVGVALLWVKLRGRRLDRAFATHQERGEQVDTRARTWTGTASGRPFRAWVARGPRFELYIECDVGTRGAVRRVGPVLRKLSGLAFAQGEPVAPPPELADCEVLSHDPAWAAELLARPGVAATAAELMRPSPRVAPGILWTPGAVGYLRAFLPLSEVVAENVERWSRDLATIAAAVEAQGPSQQHLAESRLERWSRRSRRMPVSPLWIGLGCGLLAVAGIAILSLGVVLWLESR